MSFKIGEFNSEIAKSGFARPAFFMMMITLPHQLISSFPEFSKSIPFRVESAALPTRIILTHDQRYYGPQRRIPYGFVSQDLHFSVILSEDMREREVFMRWQDMLVGASRTTKSGSAKAAIFDAGYYSDAIMGASVELRAYATSPAMQGGPHGPTLVNELTDIARAFGFDPSVATSPFGIDIGLSGSNRNIDAAYTVTLVEPFPINVQEVPLAWNDDGYGKLNVIMQYRYTVEQTNFSKNPTNGSLSSVLRNGINIFNRFQPELAFVRQNGLGALIDTFGGQISQSLTNAITHI